MKDLVYYTVGYSSTYIDVITLSITSLRKFNSTVDIAVLCDVSMEAQCKSVFPSDVHIRTFTNSKTPEESSMRKLHIFDTELLCAYDRALFIDCDIVVHVDVQTILDNLVNPEVLYVGDENDQRGHKHIYYSLLNYTKEDYAFFEANSIIPFNAGCFGFVVSPAIKAHFDAINDMIRTHKGRFFYEQSFMNAYFNRINKTDRTVLTKSTYTLFPKSNTSYGGTLVHFTGGPGNAKNKIYRMKQYMDRELFTTPHTGACKIYDTRIDMMMALVPKGGVMAEIGVFQGTFSKDLLALLSPSRLYLMDLFQGPCMSGNQDGNHVISCDMDQSYVQLQEFAKGHPEVTVVKGDSSTVLRTFPDNTFDMIYIDGDHSYQGCKKDLEAAYKVLKPNGWLMGHDYDVNMKKANTAWKFGVRQAVDEFLVTYKQTIHAKGDDGCVSFAIQLQKD
jgi:hypothetical protein